MSYASYLAAVARSPAHPSWEDGYPDPFDHGGMLGAWSVWECGGEGGDRLIALFADPRAADAVCADYNGRVPGLDYRVSREYVWEA